MAYVINLTNGQQLTTVAREAATEHYFRTLREDEHLKKVRRDLHCVANAASRMECNLSNATSSGSQVRRVAQEFFEQLRSMEAEGEKKKDQFLAFVGF